MLKPLLSCSAALLAAILIPDVARAETLALPVEEPLPPPEPALEELAAPEPPPPPPAPAVPDPCAPSAERSCGPAAGDPCGGIAHARWGKGRGRLAIGMSRGRVEMEDDAEGTQRSLIARLTGRRGWAVELELSKLRLGEDDGRLAGGAIVKAFGRRKLAPYVLAGAGGGRLERADGSEQYLRFAEVGGGLMLRKGRLSLGVDVRRGARRLDDRDVDRDPAEMAPIVRRRVEADDRERYTRGRIVALFHF